MSRRLIICGIRNKGKMMKRMIALCVALVVASTVFFGCNNQGGENNRSGMSGNIAQTLVSGPQELMTSEKDVFHPKSRIESARKGKLTNFGVITSELPEPTLDVYRAREVLIKREMLKFGVTHMYNKKLIFTSFPFDYENDIASLKVLSKMHKIDRIINPDMNELEKIEALSIYTYKFLEGGTIPEDGMETGPSAFFITKNRREKGIGGTSATYAALLCQLSLSCGYNARLVSMHTLDESGNPLTHDICEVYLNSHEKWVAFDPASRATYYVRANTPLSALEIHTIVVESRIGEISPVSGVGDLTDIVSVREDVLPRYQYLYMWRMTDILSKSPRGGTVPWKTLYQAHLVWEDLYSPVSKGGFEKLDAFANGGVKFVTHTRTDFEWNLNLVNITMERTGEESIKFYFNTVTPNLDYIKITDNNKLLKSANIMEKKKLEALLYISTVNAFGVEGNSSMVNTEY